MARGAESRYPCTMQETFPVVWRREGASGSPFAGSLRLSGSDFELEGSRGRQRGSERVSYWEITGTALAADPVERLNGRPTLRIARIGQAALQIACPIGIAGASAIADALAAYIS